MRDAQYKEGGKESVQNSAFLGYMNKFIPAQAWIVLQESQ
jgi:hypothetical protein